ncbi:glycerophosphocholine phosphodiesterase GPCPD1-like [Physella acuta]|uniref:glycerophosphocholine phosphodiesterase GPCPD1-like n=1 Tax=Physella acuta TaxID=109671 RepID=UPI0027DE933D|nr:glycerophosphocholine phosphodiesterase GPCPD1-like [Physella acuta]XP_059171984.1 glycerophosphocholine phosphodiesterase GPCPD1-like [Physella acuta]XP_059171985.1 glycerophosphocholine phosphodiesterase GPCPD1-like [Physella acuta]
MSINVMFRVNVETFKGQVVCVVGDDPLLGVWDPLKAVVMERDFTGQNWKQWKCSIALQVNTTYHYRFFVCKQQQISKKKSECSHDPKTARAPGLTVYKWETNIKPRHFTTGGNCDLLELPESVFGKYDDEFNVGKGWLINQSEVQIRLHSNPIYMWKARHREQTYSIKCIAMDYSSQNDPSVNDDNDDSQDGPVPCSVDDVLACNLADEDSQPEIQGPAGMLYNKDSYVVFRKQLQDTQLEGFQLDFFVCEQNRAPKFVGSAHLLPFKQKESQYSRKFPIIGCNHKPIGEIMVDILIGRPVPGLVMTMETTFQTRWKWRKAGDKPLDIGHRGMGVSYSQVVNPLKENTLASFAAAAGHGADFVEFDVLLSRDKKPVIYHDFSVKALYSNRTKHNVPSELFEIPVKSLTLAQLQSMKLFSSDHSHIEINEETDEESKEPFPTLEKVLKVVDENTGFDIEIKYPQLDINEVWEMENYFDVNENLDHILQVVFAHAGSRKIVFSSFDPDTCILLQLKQNKYPVLFLHQGQTKIYTPYKDYRAYSFKNGIGFAVSENFLGLALHSEVLLQDMSLINRVLNKKLVLFVWGSDNNNPKMIRMLRDHKVDGIIYDRIDCHKPEYHPEFELVSETAAQSFMNVVQMDDRATVHYASSPDQNGAISEFTLDQPTLAEAVAAKTDLVESINKQLTCALVDTESA